MMFPARMSVNLKHERDIGSSCVKPNVNVQSQKRFSERLEDLQEFSFRVPIVLRDPILNLAELMCCFVTFFSSKSLHFIQLPNHTFASAD